MITLHAIEQFHSDSKHFKTHYPENSCILKSAQKIRRYTGQETVFIYMPRENPFSPTLLAASGAATACDVRVYTDFTPDEWKMYFQALKKAIYFFEMKSFASNEKRCL